MSKTKEVSQKVKQCIHFSLILSVFLMSAPQAWADPVSSNYELKNYSFNNGGDTVTSTNYGILGTNGEISTDQINSPNYKANTGLVFTETANIPPAPTFINPNSYYNKLKLTINQSNNSTDTKYAIMISTDNFVSDIRYVQTDNTISTSFNANNYQNYTNWGGASGFNIIGLNPNTNYKTKVSAKQGKYTASPFGPRATASTVGSTLSFDIDIAATDTETSAPYILDLGNLTPNTITTASNKVWLDLTTNAANGGSVYIYDNNSGLNSSTKGYTITSSTADLSSSNEGYGAINSTVSQTSGGPMIAMAPYNGSNNNVGILDTSKRLIYDSSNSPVTSGRVSFQIKAKSKNVTPAANDYLDTLTLIATANY